MLVTDGYSNWFSWSRRTPGSRFKFFTGCSCWIIALQPDMWLYIYSIYIYAYTHIHTHIQTYIYIYLYIYTPYIYTLYIYIYNIHIYIYTLYIIACMYRMLGRVRIHVRWWCQSKDGSTRDTPEMGTTDTIWRVHTAYRDGCLNLLKHVVWIVKFRPGGTLWMHSG